MDVITIVTGIIYTNTYLVVDKDKCLIVDPGDNTEMIALQVGLNNLQPIAILLTHGHFDHCGAATELAEKYDIMVYGHEFDVELAANASKNRWGITVKDCIVTNAFNEINRLSIPPFEVEVLHTPGHTNGSVCYIIGDCMFSGDTLFAGDVGRTDLETGDKAKMNESIKKLKAITKEYTVYPGHEEATTLQTEINSNKYFRNI